MRKGSAPLVALALVALPLAIVSVEAASFLAWSRGNGTIVSSGQTREYLLHVPRGHDRSRPAPLVISLHGLALRPSWQRDLSRWNEVADEQGFLVVYPAGTGSPRRWRAFGGPDLEEDVRFISDLIDRLVASHGADPERVYADGLSNGGGMAFALSCALSERIAAVGMVAAAQTLPRGACGNRRAVPMIAFHGTEDRFTPYHGGSSPVTVRKLFPSIPGWMASAARRNGCDERPVVSAVGRDVTRAEYPGCRNQASVVLYTIDGGGHTWPGGRRLPEWAVGRQSDTVDATRVMWRFFREHPRTRE